jgi:hypothetical protein
LFLSRNRLASSELTQRLSNQQFLKMTARCATRKATRATAITDGASLASARLATEQENALRAAGRAGGLVTVLAKW